jgi:hypothetical protein
MRNNAPFFDSPFAAADIFEDSQFVIQSFEGFDIHYIGGGPTVLGDEDRVFVTGHGSNYICSLSLQGRDQFRLHE